jgi:chromosomal replication initiator protein
VMVPRQTYCWIAKRFTGRSLPEIGKSLGGRDHTTALHAVRRVQSIVDQIMPAPETPEAWTSAIFANWGLRA